MTEEQWELEAMRHAEERRAQEDRQIDALCGVLEAVVYFGRGEITAEYVREVTASVGMGEKEIIYCAKTEGIEWPA